jgi:protein-L-isoaspartate(D-aspartate) O-methyltransferase
MDRIDKAFNSVNRADFIPENFKKFASLNTSLPIGYGQTISQPYVVASMLNWLDPQPGDKVLDVGSGSGWTTALLSHLVGNKGRVEAIELIPELLEFGKNNVRKTGIKNARFHLAGKALGWPDHAPYDAILVSATTKELPQELVDQLKVGGKLVIPVAYDILEITKESTTEVSILKHPGFIFVPLI